MLLKVDCLPNAVGNWGRETGIWKPLQRLLFRLISFKLTLKTSFSMTEYNKLQFLNGVIYYCGQ